MTTVPKTPQGGIRAGAGRPSMGLVRVPLRLSAEDVERAKKLGAGNVTAGIRKALAVATVKA